MWFQACIEKANDLSMQASLSFFSNTGEREETQAFDEQIHQRCANTANI
jgi:hypothetical protein